MYKIHENTKKFYEQNPELMEQRMFIAIQSMEDYLQAHDMMKLAKPAFEKWDKLLAIARNYYIFPDNNDMKKIVDELYQKYETI